MRSSRTWSTIAIFLLLLAGCSNMPSVPPVARAELAPNGKLRVDLIIANQEGREGPASSRRDRGRNQGTYRRTGGRLRGKRAHALAIRGKGARSACVGGAVHDHPPRYRDSQRQGGRIRLREGVCCRRQGKWHCGRSHSTSGTS